MNKTRSISQLFTFAILVVASVVAVFGQKTVEPRIFLLQISSADAAKKPSDPALGKIERDAKRALTEKVEPVTSKTSTPPSGDKHDYMSQAPYFWKNPDTANGLPYIRRDGERNPEIKNYPDHDLMDKMVVTVERLSVGYFVTHKPEYAARAAEILRMWFLDPKTRMNPNLEFAQAIPGLNTGRGIGIIETRGLTRVVDSIGLLAGSQSWSKSDQAGLEDWFSRYLAWMMESKNGKNESAAKNNHGTHYDVQAACFALFVHKDDLAKKILEAAKEKRIESQIRPDGQQPLELERTKSWSYSVMNLDGMVNLAQLGDHVGLDLWSYQNSKTGGIRRAILFLAPFAREPKKWPHKQIEPLEPQGYYKIVGRAGRKYKDAEIQKIASLAATDGGSGKTPLDPQ